MLRKNLRIASFMRKINYELYGFCDIFKRRIPKKTDFVIYGFTDLQILSFTDFVIYGFCHFDDRRNLKAARFIAFARNDMR